MEVAKTRGKLTPKVASEATTSRLAETGGKAAATRLRLLDAAAKVLADKGFTGMRLADVGEVAGVQAPAIYYHFNNKEELAGEVFTAGLVRSRLTLENVLEKHGESDALERLGLAIDAHLRMTARQSDYARASTHRITGDVPASVQEYCRPFEKAYAQVWARLLLEAKEEGLLRDDIDLKSSQLMLLGALNAVSYSWRPDKGKAVDAVILSAQEMLLSGLSAEDRDWSDLEPAEVDW